MKISVLIAAYRAGPYIEKALGSIRAQTHQDWELVAVEDGSHDNTEASVSAFATSVAQPVRYVNLGQNRGVATARSRLLTLAEGDAVAFLDADDWWTPEHLASIEKALARAGTGLAVAPLQYFDLDSGQPLEAYRAPAAYFANPVATLFQTSWIVTSSSVALSRAAIEAVGGFDPAFRIGEDRDYWLRVALSGFALADSGTQTVFYSKHSSSTMARTLLWAEQEIAFYEKYLDHARLPLSVRRQYLSHSLRNYARLRRKENPHEAFRAMRRATTLQPLLMANWMHLILTMFSPKFLRIA